MTKRPVDCTACGKARYVAPPIPSPYVCQRCQASGKTPAKLPKRRGDPFYRDDDRRAAVNAGSERRWWPARDGPWLA